MRALRRRLAHASVTLGAAWPRRPLVEWMRRANGVLLSAPELVLVARAVRRRAPCRFLVFGLGNDSAFWRRLNRRGETVFVEDDPEWYGRVLDRWPDLTAHLVRYATLRSQWRELLDAPERLEMALPEPIAAAPWDVILVDGPAGWSDATPGRMRSIFLAARLAAEAGDVFVHDCDREVERAYCDRFLPHGGLVGEIGLLRRYRIGSSAREAA